MPPRKHATESGLPLPRYHQIYLVLREQIAEGHFGPSDSLPGEVALAERFGVSRVTVRAALDRLEKEDLILRQRGRGTFARPQQKRPAGLQGALENIVSMGLRTTVRVIHMETIAPPPDVEAALGLSGEERVQKAVRIRSYKGAPLSHITTFVPERIAHSFGSRQLQARPMLVLIEETGIKVDSADQTISAKLADSAVAPLLEVEIGAPLLAVNRTVYDNNHRPVQVLRGLYRPDRYEYHMHLSRVGDETRIWVSRDG